MKDPQSVFYVVALAGVIATFVGWTHRKVVKPIHTMLNALMSIVEAQLMPNHGTSLVDKVDQLRDDHEEIKQHVLGIDEAMKKHDQEGHG